MKPTRTDVAKLAGVSTATVSNVMNNSHKVKEETVARVLYAMERLNYQPNMVARSLSTRKTMQIGIVLEDVQNPYYGKIVKYFEAAANQRGYFVNICIGSDNLDHYFDNFIARGLDGAFVAALPSTFDAGKLDHLLKNDIKLVVSGNVDVDTTRIASIENHYTDAMRRAIDYLMGLGHRSIAYLSGLGMDLRYDLRCMTYLRHMQEVELPSILVDGEAPYHTDVRAGYRQAQRLLESKRRFTAVICGNDLMAIGAMRAFREQGLRIPEDVSVMGFDGITLGRYLSPSLTTMAVDAKAFGEKAFELLYTSMTQNKVGVHQSELTLWENESTGPCP